MFYLIGILLVGINAAPFLISKLDIWHAQGMWVQVGVLVVFSWSFFERSRERCVKNVPLGLMNLWAGLHTAYICYLTQLNGKYDIVHFFPYFNFLCLLILYTVIVKHVTHNQIVMLLTWMRYAVIVTLFMCVAQVLGLSQFFQLYTTENKYLNNICVGFIGNGTHLSGFLAMTSPLFFYRNKREDWLALLLLFIVLFFTGTTLNDPSISGFIVLFCCWMFFIKKNKIKVIVTLLVLMVGYLIAYPMIPETFYSATGRVSLWQKYWVLFHQMPITGPGLGTVNILFKNTSWELLDWFWWGI